MFVSAHLKKADFTGAESARADFAFADLREVKFECNSVGKDLQCAQLQGVLVTVTGLYGASLRNVFVWRAKPPATGQMTDALIENPNPEPKIFWAQLRAQ